MVEELTKEQFCARFVTEMLRIAGPKDSEGHSVEDYAKDAAPTYFDDPDQREAGPEECAQSDFSYWE
ncbi:hypothetical protein MKK58_04490 [Methylobacterium sp. J-078]|nr:hypothetical protein [Methylobacterium sp. J-078]